VADALVAAADVPVGGGVILGSRNVVVTQPAKGQFEGFSATCTHQGCTLASVASGTINCGCHGSQFSITDGSNVAGPSGSPAGSVAALPKVAVKVKGGEVIPA
jgi:nitrite reductase/ring-hydroxylating ferredoxin subunit